MDPNSWLHASGERPHLLPRVEQSYIYEPQIPGPSTAPQEAWIAGHLRQAGPSGLRISQPSDFSMSMLLAPRGPAAPAPTHKYRPHTDTYQTHCSSTESLDSMDEDSLSDDEEYQRYEKMALEELERRRGGPLLSSNPRMRREVAGANNYASSDDADSRPASNADVTSSADVNSSAIAASRTRHANAASSNVSSSGDVTTGPADDTYRRKRDRNNHAAKLSRDKRRLREMTMKIREAFLKMKLREDLQLYETVQYQRNLTRMRFEL